MINARFVHTNLIAQDWDKPKTDRSGKKRANNEKIAAAVGLSPSTVSWHMLKLVQGGLVEKRRVGRKTFFYIVEANRIAGLLKSYKRSFLDEMVDSFVEIWEEMNPEPSSRPG